MKNISKEEFIADYLNKSIRLKNHKLPYGIEYFKLLAKVEKDAEKSWNKLTNQHCKNEN